MSRNHPPPPPGFTEIPPPPTGFSLTTKRQDISPPAVPVEAGDPRLEADYGPAQFLGARAGQFRESAVNLATGLPSAMKASLEAYLDLHSGHPGKALELLKGAAYGTVEGPIEMGTAALGGDGAAMARGAGKTVFQTLPAIYGLKGARAPLSKAGVPERLITGAAASRVAARRPVNPVLSVAFPKTAALATGIRAVAKPVRLGKAWIQEQAAKAIASGDKPPVVAERAPLFEGAAPPAPASVLPEQFSQLERAKAARAERPPIPQEPIDRTPLLGQAELEPTPPYQPARYTAPLEEPGPFFANQKPLAARGQDLPFNPPESMMAEGPNVASVRMIRTREAIRPLPSFQKIVGTQQFITDLYEAAPEIVSLPPGRAFDAGLFKAFKRVEDNVIQADATIPPEVTVPKAAVTDGFEALAKKLEADGWDKAASSIRSEAEAWDAMPTNIPWPEFSRVKKHFLRETSKVSSTLQRAYGVLREAGELYSNSDVLQKANREYATVRTAMDAAKMHLKEGFRIREVGKPPKALKVETVKELRGGQL